MLDRIAHIVIGLHHHNPFHAVLPGEAGHGPLAMFPRTAGDIVRHADIECSAFLAGQNVDEVGHG